MKYLICFLSVLFCCIACKSKSEDKTPYNSTALTSSTSLDIKKIDIHTHYRNAREYLPELLKKWNMQTVLVDVSKEDSTGIIRSWDLYLNHQQKHPELFSLCSSLIGTDIDSPDFAQNNIERLSKEIKAGAKMVKVWKNFGMETKDASGNFIQIDDHRLQPIWNFLQKQGIAVIAHIGEPEQAWRAIDSMNPHALYYKNNPQYHAYKIPEIPRYETIITARDNWIRGNPNLKILCAHLGSMSHYVNMVAERLDKCPNMYVELAARFGDLVGQDSEKVKDFFTKYQDRILFGTDYGNSTPQDSMRPDELNNEKIFLDESYERLWKYLSSKDSVEIRKQKNIGLELPIDVLNKVYYKNALNFLKLE